MRVKRAKIKISAITTLVLSHYTLGWNIQRRFMDIKRNFPSVHHHYYEGNAKKLLLIVVRCATQSEEDRRSKFNKTRCRLHAIAIAIHGV